MVKAGVTGAEGATVPALYVVATPIGNLADITLRALDVLRTVDTVAAEDTRLTQHLLDRHGIRASLMSLHEHNERKAAARVVELLSAGQSVALVTDAGTPGISDPGAIAVAQARQAGFPVVPVPGASALIAAISASGMAAPPFSFHGFLPSRKSERERQLAAIAPLAGLQVFYEAPHRIVESVESMAKVLGEGRQITLAREITKVYEQFHACLLGQAAEWLRADEHRRRGEFVLMVEGSPGDSAADGNSQEVLKMLLEELPLSRAVALAARITGAKKNELYQKALELNKD